MNKIIQITPKFAVTGALLPEDFAEIANKGFKSILSNLPDGEASRHPSSAEESELAAKAGLDFRHVPTVKADVLSDHVVESVTQALSELEGPVLAHCASGLRSAIAWAAAASRVQPVDKVLAALEAAGFDLSAIREELEDQPIGSSADAAPAALKIG